MALYYCKVTYTGQKEYHIRPDPETFCVRAPTMKKAADIVFKSAKKKWCWFRFETTLVDRNRILK